jgi:hypothetical protein
MSLKYGFLSLLAFCICLFTFLKSYEVWTHPIGEISENMAGRKSEGKPKVPLATDAQKGSDSIRSYILIAEKNIFSPERKDFPTAPTQQKSVVRPQVILYGVTIAGDYEAASIVSPGRPLMKGERETLTLKIGGKIGDYKLAKVRPDRVTFENGNDSFEVLLYDLKNPKKRMEAKAVSQPAAVISPQLAPVPSSREAPKLTPYRESVQEPKRLPQAQVARPLPFNKHTYRLLVPPAAGGGG